MSRKASVVIEKDEHGDWCQELKGCQSQGRTLEQAAVEVNA
jgi:predicted RNase H-like HicB family nuclease